MSLDPPANRSTSLIGESIRRRNTVADWMFYDVGALTDAELSTLLRTTNLEGSILVVEPRGADGSARIQKFETFERFRAEPGELLRHFAIAGVGSSDVGAAALARNLADHLDAPVGAIVSGYGVSDLLSEALGGYFFFGAANQALDAMHRAPDMFLRASKPQPEATARTSGGLLDGVLSPDTRTLIRLLSEEERQIETVLGHSKGCLSMFYAFQSIKAHANPDAFERTRDIDLITTGAVVAFPAGLTRLRQYLGALDWFGGLNSRIGVPYIRVPDAWHHTNTALPLHMDLAPLLSGAYD